MRHYFVDESGFTGEDLLSPDQPLFAQASNDFSCAEANNIINIAFPTAKSSELKYSRLSRNGRHLDGVVELVRNVCLTPERALVWASWKEYALIILVVDWWMEPLAHQGGLNLYKDGANLGMANMLFVCLEGFWPKGFRRRLLQHFQIMFRSRTRERFDECKRFVEKAQKIASGNQSEILRYFYSSFILLGYEHVLALPARVLDIALPGLIYIGHVWNERRGGPWTVVHDTSSNMAKQKWMWDAISSPDLPHARFANTEVAGQFPMNVARTRFGDSQDERQLQICDVLAGACSAFLRTDKSDKSSVFYRDRLAEAGIEKLFVGGLWPSTEVTPEGLDMKGWDGNLAIEWMAEQMARRRVKIPE